MMNNLFFNTINAKKEDGYTFLMSWNSVINALTKPENKGSVLKNFINIIMRIIYFKNEGTHPGKVELKCDQ